MTKSITNNNIAAPLPLGDDKFDAVAVILAGGYLRSTITAAFVEFSNSKYQLW